MSLNTSMQMLTLAWNGKRFKESKSARNAARRSIFRATTILLNSEMKTLEIQNNEINHEIDRCRHDLHKYDNKLQMLDNMTHLATQSLEVYFQARMENLGAFVTEQCRIISDGIQEEADHWKEIHAMLQQKLVVPGDLRSYGGGNGLPRPVKQSPNCSRIAEEEEEGEKEEREEKETDVSTLLQSRTLTPLLTQTLKNARLLASKLSQNTSIVIPPELNMSKTIVEEPLPTANASDNHVTLRDVSVIEKAAEVDHEIPNPDLSMSLLPFIPTTNADEEKQNNKSICSTISDKTFVKTSLKQFSSDEDSDDDDENDDEDDDETIIEDSFSTNAIESKRPLLLTADRSIRRIVTPLRAEKHSLSHIMSMEKPKFKQEKVSFREPLPIVKSQSNKTLLPNKSTIELEKLMIKQENFSFREPLPVDNNQSNFKLLPNNNTYDLNKTTTEQEVSFREPLPAEIKQKEKTLPRHETTADNDKSSHVHSTTITNSNTSKLLPIKSADSSEEDEKLDVIQPLAMKPIHQEQSKPNKSPMAENPVKRRTTRRATIRILRENQNDNLPTLPPPPPVEMPTKTRYQTRYSTRLAATVTNEDITLRRTSTVNRRTTRFTSD
ncbi:unnamed protein product [Rotaria magnacalcarata]|uniref:Uncharacterized protein n=4 Tax=Rotaria magnacalcarata TaxID=392030 RepID=A0A815KDP2_9BILA|nr:unnamed protein product [Rotaria magnacalcarata]CAF2029649.1 unnamed protein product [Rotaria magnacalcarata]